MCFVRSFTIGTAVLLFSFSLVYADAADDLLRALGEPLPVENSLETTPLPVEPVAQMAAASSTEEIAAFEAQKQAQVSQLQVLVAQLSQKLQELLAKKAADDKAAAQAVADAAAKVKAEAESPSKCTRIKRNLTRGDKGQDVRCLQFVLVADRVLDPENVTGAFGPLTEKAVKLFQLEIGVITAPGSVGPRTLAEINAFIPFLGEASTYATTTPEKLDSVTISFGPQLPNGVEAEDFVLLAKEKNVYALRITSQITGTFGFKVDWGDGVTETGATKSGVFKTLSHAYSAGVHEVKIVAFNSSGESEDSFTLGITAAGGEGDLLEITSPLTAFTFDVVTLMPVTIHSKDSRANGNVRLFLQDSSTARPGTGVLVGEMDISSGDANSKFPLTDVAPGTYWLQAIGARFQDCSTGSCQEFLPNHTVGPIQITDKTNFYAMKMASSSQQTDLATTSEEILP